MASSSWHACMLTVSFSGPDQSLFCYPIPLTIDLRFNVIFAHYIQMIGLQSRPQTSTVEQVTLIGRLSMCRMPPFLSERSRTCESHFGSVTRERLFTQDRAVHFLGSTVAISPGLTSGDRRVPLKTRNRGLQCYIYSIHIYMQHLSKEDERLNCLLLLP